MVVDRRSMSRLEIDNNDAVVVVFSAGTSRVVSWLLFHHRQGSPVLFHSVPSVGVP